MWENQAELGYCFKNPGSKSIRFRGRRDVWNFKTARIINTQKQDLDYVMKFSLVYTFFRTLSLAHLERSLYSLSRQTIKPDEFIFFENNTDFSEDQIMGEVCKYFDPDTIRFSFNKHGDPRKTSASWCQNRAIQMATNDVFILAKADLIYDFDFCRRILDRFIEVSHYGTSPLHFTSCYMMQMAYYSQTGKPHEQVDHAADLEPLEWREDVQRLNLNQTNCQYHTHTASDAPSFCTTQTAMRMVDWYDEDLIGWGFWQLSLQSDMKPMGIQFHIIPETLMFHMLHSIEGPDRCLQRAQAEFNQSRRQMARRQ
jgi:hypothetical protein